MYIFLKHRNTHCHFPFKTRPDFFTAMQKTNQQQQKIKSVTSQAFDPLVILWGNLCPGVWCSQALLNFSSKTIIFLLAQFTLDLYSWSILTFIVRPIRWKWQRDKCQATPEASDLAYNKFHCFVLVSKDRGYGIAFISTRWKWNRRTPARLLQKYKQKREATEAAMWFIIGSY